MKKRKLNNIGLKILSLVCAIIMWVVIINVNDPSDKRTITNVTVDMINQNTLTDLGYTYEILEGSKISVVVKGPKSVISSLDASDIYLCADFSTISPLSDFVEITAKCTKAGISENTIEITPKVSAVRINIENRETKNFDVEMSIVGSPANGYAIGNNTVSPASVKITGAESTIESIDKVVAEYDISGATFDVADGVVLKLYDEEGNLIDDSKLVYSRQKVNVKIQILKVKEVPVNYVITGEVAEGYAISSVEYQVETAVVAGTESALAEITSIDIPASIIDVTGLSESEIYEIKIGQYVPTTVRLLSENKGTVTVNIDELKTKKIIFTNNDITVKNLDEQYAYEILDEEFNVTYQGLEADLEGIVLKTGEPVIDLSGYAEGEYAVIVEMPSFENCETVGTITANVAVVKVEE